MTKKKETGSDGAISELWKRVFGSTIAGRIVVLGDTTFRGVYDEIKTEYITVEKKSKVTTNRRGRKRDLIIKKKKKKRRLRDGSP